MNGLIRKIKDYLWASCEALGEWARLGGRPF